MVKKFPAILFLFFHSLISFEQPKDGVNYLAILRRAAQYRNDDIGQFPKFTYQSSTDSALAALRKNFSLDSIAGFGNETSRLINLLHWVHNTVSHDGQHESGIININASEIITVAKTKHIGVSCGELAMGWKSRKIYCFPKDSLKDDHDSHVINAVYLSSKGNGSGLTLPMMPT